MCNLRKIIKEKIKQFVETNNLEAKIENAENTIQQNETTIQSLENENVEKIMMAVLAGGHVPTQNRFFLKIGLRELLTEFEGVIMG